MLVVLVIYKQGIHLFMDIHVLDIVHVPPVRLARIVDFPAPSSPSSRRVMSLQEEKCSKCVTDDGPLHTPLLTYWALDSIGSKLLPLLCNSNNFPSSD